MGFVPEKDIKIVFTGLRKGEKLYEELYDPDCEILNKTEVDGILRVRAKSEVDRKVLDGPINDLMNFHAEGNEKEATELLRSISGMKGAVEDDKELLGVHALSGN